MNTLEIFVVEDEDLLNENGLADIAFAFKREVDDLAKKLTSQLGHSVIVGGWCHMDLDEEATFRSEFGFPAEALVRIECNGLVMEFGVWLYHGLRGNRALAEITEFDCNHGRPNHKLGHHRGTTLEVVTWAANQISDQVHAVISIAA